jgi:ATP-dependent helicase/nuclease subunit B
MAEGNESERRVNSPSAAPDASTPLTIQQLFEALRHNERATVVTPNRRLAVYLKDQFDAAQLLAANKAWATPDIVPLATFFERTYRILSLRAEAGPQPQLLDAAQSQLLWEQVVRATDVSSHLLSVAQTARQAASAWALAHAWGLLPDMRKFPLSEDAEVFYGWAGRFEQLCREGDLIDMAAVPTALTACLQSAEANAAAAILPDQLFVAGFDINTPQQQLFLTACGVRGVPTARVQTLAANPDANCRRVEFPTADAELRGCAAWARQRLQTNPGQRIAIVVPELRSKRGAIARALTDALQPGLRAAALRGSAATLGGFNISLGPALNEYALVHDALALIEMSQGRAMPFLRVSALLRSPFIHGGDSEMAARARLDVALREVVAPEISLFALQRKLKLANAAQLSHAIAGCPKLLARIDRVAGMAAPASSVPSARKPSPRDWSRHFGQVLLAWGFPGDDKLDSSDYQVLEKFRDALAALALLESVQPRMRGSEALNQLRSIVADTVFQPEAAHSTGVQIQVLGILESAGQAFDALWVTGLHDEAWPLAARPNPFIPIALQRAAGVTEASAETSLALDERITEGWRTAAAEVVFSHSQSGDDGPTGEQPRAASALTRAIEPTEMSALIGTGAFPDYAAALFAISQREAIPDQSLAALSIPTKVGGGATVLRDQAACPFRAFVRHRLGARALATPQAGLDSATRGTLLHRVMSLVWTDIASHARLIAMDEGATRGLAVVAVTQAISEANAGGAHSLVARFADIEQRRLVRLVIDWLAYERERAPFSVVACEQARDVTLSGLSMRLRLDRLDQLEDGTHALIDYKTGAAKVASWLGERPDEPQLPLYFQTAGQTISALAFARVKRGTRGKTFGFEGVSAAEGLLTDVGPIENKYGMEKRGYVSWDVLTAEWETALSKLAKNFLDSDVAVDPKNGNLTCAQCDLQTVCRISELHGAPILDEGDADQYADAADAAVADE